MQAAFSGGGSVILLLPSPRSGGLLIPHLRPLVLALLAIAPTAASLAPEPYAPTAVFALKAADVEAVVSWVPGPELADSYNVYGITPAGRTFLGQLTPMEEPDPLSLVVPATFPAYAVSGFKDGHESTLVYALQTVGDCLVVSVAPPSASVDDCPIIGGKLHPAHRVRRLTYD